MQHMVMFTEHFIGNNEVDCRGLFVFPMPTGLASVKHEGSRFLHDNLPSR